MTDLELIAEYRKGSQKAFASLARRHVDWVYSAARRRLGDAHLAEDVTQAVFLVVARNPPRRWGRRSLAPWLFGILMRICKTTLRREVSRRRRETEAAKMRAMTTENSTSADWDEIAPHLEELVAKLRSSDREIILLRYYEQRGFAEIGQMLGVSEEAARKRVSRATETLRSMLSRSGVSMTASALPAILIGETAKPAPAMVFSAITSATTGASSTVAISLSKGAVTMLAASKVKVAAIVCIAIILAAGAGIGVFKVGRNSNTTAPTRSVAVAALPELPIPQTIAEATEQMNMLYGLANGEVIRIIPPPFAPAREVWLSAVKNPPVQPLNVPFMGVRWTAQGLEGRPSTYGGGGIYLSSIQRQLNLQWYEIDGLNHIAWRPLDGDLVTRTDATRAQKVEAVAALLRRYREKPFRLTSEKRTRPCIVVVGEQQAKLKRPDGFAAVLFTANAPDESIKAKSRENSGPSAFSLAHSFESLGELLDAPMFREPPAGPLAPRLPQPHDANIYVVAPDARLNSSDPQYRSKLRKILDVARDQVGGEWRIEERQIETFVLEPRPERHPAQDAVDALIGAASRGDVADVARRVSNGGSARIDDLTEILKVNENVPFIEIWADDSDACVLSEQVADPLGRPGRLKFYVSNQSGQWQIQSIDFSRSIPREQFLREHPHAGIMQPFPAARVTFGQE